MVIRSTPALTPTEKRRILRDARASGTLTWPLLDRLLLAAARTPAALAALVRSLDDVMLVDEGDTILAHRLELTLPAGAGADHFGRYADQVRRLPRLTRQEEYALARRLEFAHKRVERAVAAAVATASERATLIDSPVALETHPDATLRAAYGDYNRLRTHFVERNLYLVIGMSTAYRTYGLPMMDLVQEANASLIRAVEKFDWRKDVRFQTYAAFWVRQAIERLITANRGIVRVPNYIQQKLRRLRREGKLARNPRDVDLREVSRQFEASPEAAARLMETDRNWFSLDAPLSDEGSSISSVLAAEEAEQVMSPSERMALSQRLDEVMGETLTEQERRILALRFGLGGAPPKTLDEIGAQMSVSRERIRQLQVKALDKLHKPRLLEELKDFL